jgi:UDP-3-O-[3-hydroxymyristoyl] glucosamine N-acyltransferase
MILSEILDFVQPLSFHGDKDTEIKDAQGLQDLKANSIGWCSDKNIELLQSIVSGTILISAKRFGQNLQIPKGLNLLVVENPRKVFASILNQFFTQKPIFGKISESATIDLSVIYNSSRVIIGSNVVIEENCSLGDFCFIDHNTVIKAGTVIAENVKIGCNCTIGGVGFGYEPNDLGVYEMIPHIGNVVINSHVEIGNNVCIDRAVMGATILHEHVKVDNLVHIAHGVSIGKNSLVIANAMIAGSVQIGENSWIAPSASIKQKVTIGNNALVGLGSVVLKDVEDQSIVAGVPAKKIN